jgi:hypothetical protein
MMMKRFAIAIATCWALSGCGNDDGSASFDASLAADSGNPADAGGNDGSTGNCDTMPHFSSIYSVILSKSMGNGACAVPSCHGPFPSGGLEMDKGKDMAFAALTTGGTFDSQAKTTIPDRVKAGDPMHSFLYLKISEDTPPGTTGSRMPLGATPLSQCEIDAFKTWIMNGAMND